MVGLRRRLAQAGAATLCVLVGSSLATVSKGLSLRSQLPDIAHVGVPYTWTFSPDTFHSTGQAVVNLSADGLPDWATFDASQRTFSGNPTADNDGGDRITVRATQDGQRGASDAFTLLVIDAPVPTVNKPLTSQLPQASSLGGSHMLPGDKLFIPLGWSFSVGFQGDTFTLPDGSNVYLSASLAGGQPLPDWLIWSSDSYTMYGVAPDQVGPEGSEFDFVLTGSNRAGFGGPTTALTIVVATNQTQAQSQTLTLAQPLQSVNASVGEPVSYTIPTTGLNVSGQQAPQDGSDAITVSANVSDVAWLRFDGNSHTLEGTPPYDQYKDANSTQAIVVPLVFSGQNGSQSLPANITVNVAPFPFVAQQLPNIFVDPGKAINQSLAAYVRPDIQQSSSSLRILAVAGGAAPALSVSFDPASASSSLQFDPKTLLLTGSLPKDVERVKVNLQSTSSQGQSSAASFYLAQKGDNPPTTKSSNASDAGDGNGGMSPRARIALTASLSAFGGLCALVLLLMCCRRHVAKEDHDTQGNILPYAGERTVGGRRSGGGGDDDDERTLTDRGSARWKRAIVVSAKKKDVEATPTTLADASPYMMHDEKLSEGHQPAAQEVADQPTQNRLVAGLFGGGNKKQGAAAARAAGAAGAGAAVGAAATAGLGLGLDPSDDPYAQSAGRVRHSRSRQSVRSSWEQSLFYDDAEDEQQQQQQQRDERNSVASSQSFKSTRNGTGAGGGGGGGFLTVTGHDQGQAEVEEVPRRRPRGGQPSILQFRHRNTHINESPAFHAPGVFTPATDTNGSHAGHGAEDDADASEDFHDSRTGLSNAGHEDAQILEARVMQVRRHSPMQMHANDASNLTRTTSRTADPMNVNGAFDDADDEIVGTSAQQANNNRSSTMSNQSQLRAMQPHVIYPQESPNPSFMDGASVSGFDPRDSMKPVGRPKTPPAPAAAAAGASSSSGRRQQQHQRGKPSAGGSSSSSASSRHLPCPDHEAVPGQHLRFHIYPAQPPPMAGPPGSPGKRSGEVVRYGLVVDDPQLPHLSLQWPDMMADWLTFDPSTFEASGWVPHDFANMGHIVIALVSSRARRTSTTAAGGSSSQAGHARRTSTDSNATVVNEDEVSVCAKARLVFAGPNQAAPPHAF
ncbi:hypothetical protein FA10DRAFT_54331 [Acaromyces ingoldii]|uniref:Dystroglycan-type cadherin-like domain-containing protein n=1 Tax=Acaromyces ingoldii TaxID=215250 RepID=A0A316Y8T9_9BASI|nr:hypothetical protein FA10DRAFT_54331 [Acaromyces ingoldii]PWN86590.1 hypothetical protein FA10DRAFT_54331 [Acaromyces ingoldii]